MAHSSSALLSQRDYGNRVGIVRLMELLRAHGIRSTVALNSDLCDQHPEIVDACGKLDWDYDDRYTNAVVK
jgi:hypothetical protein